MGRAEWKEAGLGLEQHAPLTFRHNTIQGWLKGLIHANEVCQESIASATFVTQILFIINNKQNKITKVVTCGLHDLVKWSQSMCLVKFNCTFSPIKICAYWGSASPLSNPIM